jgi:hypothetical protein
MKKNVGLVRQQTVNSDYIVCTKIARIADIKCDKLEVESIESPTISTLISLIHGLNVRLSAAEEFILNLKNNSAPYTSGSIVATTIHFDDIDLDSVDQESFELSLKETLAAEAGVDIGDIQLIDIAKTGSATVRIEILYKDGSDTTKKNQLVNNLQDADGLQSILGSMGQVQAEEVQEDLPIQSMDAKIFQLEKLIARNTIALENADELRLRNYRFLIVDEEVHIQRFDNESNQYVGGTLVLDP